MEVGCCHDAINNWPETNLTGHGEPSHPGKFDAARRDHEDLSSFVKDKYLYLINIGTQFIQADSLESRYQLHSSIVSTSMHIVWKSMERTPGVGHLLGDR